MNTELKMFTSMFKGERLMKRPIYAMKSVNFIGQIGFVMHVLIWNVFLKTLTLTDKYSYMTSKWSQRTVGKYDMV